MPELLDSPLLDFEPLTWQEAFLKSEVKSPWGIGGNRSGKTHVGAFKMSCHLCGHCPVTGETYRDNGKYWAVALDFPGIDQIIMPKMEEFLEGEDWDYIPSKQLIIHNGTGSRCWLKSCDSKRKKFQGADLDGVWFDEEPPFDVFKEAWTRTIDRQGVVWGTMTPIEGSQWLYQRVYTTDDPDFQIFTMGMRDNIYLKKEEIDKAENLYRDEREVAVRIGGEFRLILGRAVLDIPSLQELQKNYLCRPFFRGNLVYPVAA